MVTDCMSKRTALPSSAIGSAFSSTCREFRQPPTESSLGYQAVLQTLGSSHCRNRSRESMHVLPTVADGRERGQYAMEPCSAKLTTQVVDEPPTSAPV